MSLTTVPEIAPNASGLEVLPPGPITSADAGVVEAHKNRAVTSAVAAKAAALS